MCLVISFQKECIVDGFDGVKIGLIYHQQEPPTLKFLLILEQRLEKDNL
jgi:hypothetical protein